MILYDISIGSKRLYTILDRYCYVSLSLLRGFCLTNIVLCSFAYLFVDLSAL